MCVIEMREFSSHPVDHIVSDDAQAPKLNKAAYFRVAGIALLVLCGIAGVAFITMVALGPAGAALLIPGIGVGLTAFGMFGLSIGSAISGSILLAKGDMANTKRDQA